MEQTLTTLTAGQIGFPRFIEVPIEGPGDANRLVILSGIANLDSVIGQDLHAIPKPGGGQETEALIHIITEYSVNDVHHPRIYQNIVDGNAELLQATYVTLSATDVDEGEFVIGIVSATADIHPEGNIQIHVTIRWGDNETPAGVDMILVTYQANVLLKVAARN